MLDYADNDREFVNSVIKELTSLSSELKLVNGKPRQSQSQGSVEWAKQDVDSWTGQSLFRAMFETEPKADLSRSALPSDVLKNIEDEENLQNFIEEINMQQN